MSRWSTQRSWWWAVCLGFWRWRRRGRWRCRCWRYHRRRCTSWCSILGVWTRSIRILMPSTVINPLPFFRLFRYSRYELPWTIPRDRGCLASWRRCGPQPTGCLGSSKSLGGSCSTTPYLLGCRGRPWVAVHRWGQRLTLLWLSPCRWARFSMIRRPHFRRFLPFSSISLILCNGKFPLVKMKLQKST